MIITIDEAASEPLYKQIHDQVIAGIATGQLEPGMSLPSVRSLASDLGINLAHGEQSLCDLERRRLCPNARACRCGHQRTE